MQQTTKEKITKIHDDSLKEWRDHANVFSAHSSGLADHYPPQVMMERLQTVFGKTAVKKAQQREELLHARGVVAEILLVDTAPPSIVRHALEKLEGSKTYKRPLRHLFPTLNGAELKEMKADLQDRGFEIRGETVTGYAPKLG